MNEIGAEGQKRQKALFSSISIFIFTNLIFIFLIRFTEGYYLKVKKYYCL